MIRNLLTLAVVAGLVYGAYLVNEKYFTSAQKQAQVIPATMVSFVCAQDVQAFDPNSPDKTIGYFTKGTEIKVGGESGVPGMKTVAYQPTNGAVIHAICKASDLTNDKNSTSTPATAPLAKKTSITGKTPGVSTALGNGQKSISQGGSSSIVKMDGKSNAKSIGETFGDNATPTPTSTPPSTAKSPEQGIKDRAKDLQNPQSQ